MAKKIFNVKVGKNNYQYYPLPNCSPQLSSTEKSYEIEIMNKAKLTLCSRTMLTKLL